MFDTASRIALVLSMGLGGGCLYDGLDTDGAAQVAPSCPASLGALDPDGDHRQGQLAGSPSLPAPFCGTFVEPRPTGEVVYTMHLDEPRNVRMNVVGSSNNSPWISIRTTCADATTTVACGRIDTTLAAGDYFVVIRAPDGGTAYALTLETDEVADNAFCEDAAVVEDGDLLTDLGSPPGAWGTQPCSLGRGPILYYLVEVPAGEEVLAEGSAAPFFEGGARITVVESCAATECHLPASFPRSGGTALWQNHGDEPRTVVLMVEGASPTSLLDLSIELRPIGYDLETVAPACDDLSAGTVVIRGHDFEYERPAASIALPFPFPLYGAATTHYFPHSQGMIQLFRAANVPPSRGGGGAVPFDDELDGFIAPYWADLQAPPNPGTGLVRTATFGDAPDRRFVIEWSNWLLRDSDPFLHNMRGPVTFQLSLGEDGVIEMRYCSLTGEADDTHLTGGDVFAGLESGDGEHSITIVRKRPGVLSSEHAFRLTPVAP